MASALSKLSKTKSKPQRKSSSGLEPQGKSSRRFSFRRKSSSATKAPQPDIDEDEDEDETEDEDESDDDGDGGGMDDDFFAELMESRAKRESVSAVAVLLPAAALAALLAKYAFAPVPLGLPSSCSFPPRFPGWLGTAPPSPPAPVMSQLCLHSTHSPTLGRGARLGVKCRKRREERWSSQPSTLKMQGRRQKRAQ